MIRVSLVLLAGLAVSTGLRKQSAALRHWVLAATIVCAALTPALSSIVPTWRLQVPAWRFANAVEPLNVFIPLRLTQSAASDAQTTDGASVSPRFPIAALLAWMWILGAIAGLAVLAIGLARLTWLARRARAVHRGPWADLATAISRAYGLRHRAILLESDHPTLLATWGIQQPKVILPSEALAWPEARIRIVLAHELAHARRRDWLVQIAADLLRAVYWFNPLAWIVCRQLRLESEHACDDAVLQMGVEGHDYAAHLVDLARSFAPHPQTVFPAPAMARPSSLERRVRAMLNARLNHAPISRTAGVAFALALAGVTASLAGVVTSAQAGNASFSGSLVDAIGKILPDTTIVLSNAQDQKYQTTSDQTGHFAFAAIPAGNYQLQVDKPGFATAQGRVALGDGQRLNRDVVLQVGNLEEHITIVVHTGEPPLAPVAPRPPVYESTPELDYCPSSVGGCITQPTKLRDFKPVYPASKANAGISGTVVVDARIGTDGFTKSFFVVSGDRDFADAAIAAIKNWQFSPTRLDGVPVEVDMRVTTVFRVE
jgi:TonB family protein